MIGAGNDIAIVTGAGRGIGAAVASRLAEMGYDVVVNDRVKELADRSADAISEAGGKAIPISADISSEIEVDQIFDECETRFGTCTLLVNNAGFVEHQPFANMSVRQWDAMQNVNLRGCFLMCRRAIGPMLNRGGGVIINMASQLGQHGAEGMAHYAAAKSGIIGLTKSLARELASSGIRVNAIAPGPIETDMVNSLDNEWRQKKLSELPLGRFGKPEEVASTVAFLASDEAALFVGQTLGPNSGDVML